MKRTLALLTVAGFALAGCSSGAASESAASDVAEKSVEAVANTPSTTLEIPDVAGMTVREAGRTLESAGFKWKLVPMIPEEFEALNLEEAKSSTDKFVVDSQNRRLGNVPEQDVILVYASPTNKLIADLKPWSITCSDGSYSEDGIEDVHYDLKSVWSSQNFEEYKDCDAEYIGLKWKPNKKELSISKTVNKHFEGSEEPEIAFGNALETCAIAGSSNYDGSESWESTPDAYLDAATTLCPEAPFYDEMKKWATGEIFEYGTYEVGKEIKPGTYESSKKVNDCYWARLTPGGDIIANNFISYAAAGAKVTVRTGEVFEAKENCGTWTKKS